MQRRRRWTAERSSIAVEQASSRESPSLVKLNYRWVKCGWPASHRPITAYLAPVPRILPPRTSRLALYPRPAVDNLYMVVSYNLTLHNIAHETATINRCLYYYPVLSCKRTSSKKFSTSLMSECFRQAFFVFLLTLLRFNWISILYNRKFIVLPLYRNPRTFHT